MCRRVAAATAMVALGVAGLSGCGSDGGGAASTERTAPGTAGTNKGKTPGPGTAVSSGTPGAVGGGASASGPPPSTPTARQSTAAAPASTVGTDVHACFDGTCEISVAKPVTIPVDDRFGFSAFKITHIGSDGVTVEATTGGTYLQSSVSPGGTAALNNLSIRVRSVTHGTATLSLTPTP